MTAGLPIVELENGRVLIESAQGPDREATPLLIIPSRELTPAEAQTLAKNLSDQFTTFVVSSPRPVSSRIFEYVDKLRQAAFASGIRRATVVGWGAGAAAAQALAVVDPKFVRRLVLINAETRVEPTLFSRFIDALERFLPLGLPLRPLSADFDSRPMLHRIRCPSLVVIQSGGSSYLSAQAQYIVKKVPNVWLVPLPAIASSELNLSLELRSLLVEFLEIPTKRPQKNSLGELLMTA